MRLCAIELGYWIGKPYWGRGLILEASRALICHAFEDLGVQRLWCVCDDSNDKSKRVMEKCGFVFDRIEEDVPCELMGDTRDEHFACLTQSSWAEGLLE